MQIMTYSEVDHLLGRTNALSQEQMQELRREVDKKLVASAPKAEPPLTERERADQEAQRRFFRRG